MRATVEDLETAFLKRLKSVFFDASTSSSFTARSREHCDLLRLVLPHRTMNYPRLARGGVVPEAKFGSRCFSDDFIVCSNAAKTSTDAQLCMK